MKDVQRNDEVTKSNHEAHQQKAGDKKLDVTQDNMAKEQSDTDQQWLRTNKEVTSSNILKLSDKNLSIHEGNLLQIEFSFIPSGNKVNMALSIVKCHKEHTI